MWRIDVRIHDLDYEWADVHDDGEPIRGATPRLPFDITVTLAQAPNKGNDEMYCAIGDYFREHYSTIDVYDIQYEILMMRVSPT